MNFPSRYFFLFLTNSTSRYTRQVWTETADAHEAATAVSACSPSRRKARADLPAPPVDSERAFPRRRPPAARPSPAPCYASWALPGTARALARPIAVRSRAEGLDTDAARLPTPLVDSEGPPLAPLLESKTATYDRYTSLLEANFVLCSTRNAIPENPSSPCTKRPSTLRARARDRT
jgi:hypothetical protein